MCIYIYTYVDYTAKSNLSPCVVSKNYVYPHKVDIRDPEARQ